MTKNRTVKGIHHVSMKVCSQKEYEKAKNFYIDILGLKILKETENCILMDTGNGIVEIFNNSTEQFPKGKINHFAFSVDDLNMCVEKIRNAGYEIFVEPKKVFIGGDENFTAEIAFCRGAIGEEIELFHQMW